MESYRHTTQYPEDNAVKLFEHDVAVRGELNHLGRDVIPRYYRRLFPAPMGKLEQMNSLQDTCTVYVANIDTTHDTEERIYNVFSRCGPIKRVVIGVNKNTREPCGFCFVIFENHESALAAFAFMQGFDMDDRGVVDEKDLLKIELDWGLHAGRQYGHSETGERSAVVRRRANAERERIAAEQQRRAVERAKREKEEQERHAQWEKEQQKTLLDGYFTKHNQPANDRDNTPRQRPGWSYHAHALAKMDHRGDRDSPSEATGNTPHGHAQAGDRVNAVPPPPPDAHRTTPHDVNATKNAAPSDSRHPSTDPGVGRHRLDDNRMLNVRRTYTDDRHRGAGRTRRDEHYDDRRRNRRSRSRSRDRLPRRRLVDDFDHAHHHRSSLSDSRQSSEHPAPSSSSSTSSSVSDSVPVPAARSIVQVVRHDRNWQPDRDRREPGSARQRRLSSDHYEHPADRRVRNDDRRPAQSERDNTDRGRDRDRAGIVRPLDRPLDHERDGRDPRRRAPDGPSQRHVSQPTDLRRPRSRSRSRDRNRDRNRDRDRDRDRDRFDRDRHRSRRDDYYDRTPARRFDDRGRVRDRDRLDERRDNYVNGSRGYRDRPSYHERRRRDDVTDDPRRQRRYSSPPRGRR